VYLKRSVMPEVSQAASARSLWSEIEARAGEVCVDDIHRNWRYGLNYYSVTPLPDCEQQPRPLAVRQTEGQPPHVAPTALVDRTQPGRTLLERSLPGDIISPFRN
jgi:hypothetical protein